MRLQRSAALVTMIVTVIVGALVATLVMAVSSARPDDGPREVVREPGLHETRAATRVIRGLDHVENSILALGSVWAVTSSRPDEISPGAFRAAVVRIDTETGAVERVLESPDVEPTFAALGDRLWVALADRIVAVDRLGTEVASIPFEGGSVDGVLAAGGRLWVVHTDGDVVTVVEPDDAGDIDGSLTIPTGDFPVAPVSAFGRVWVPGLIDGTVTVIDETADGVGDAARFVVADRPKNLMLVPGGVSGDEVWVSNLDGEIVAVSAEAERLGEVRAIDVDRSINRVVALGDRGIALPTWGRSVFGIDLETGRTVREMPLGSIPVRGVAAHGLVWVTSDGSEELLTVIDVESMMVRARFRVGANGSDTNGPQQPFVVGDEVWVPNRGDSAMYIVHLDDVP